MKRILKSNFTVVCLLIIVPTYVQVRCRNLEVSRQTIYACEGKVLNMECGPGKIIKIIRANYGRFSIAICNDHGNTDWSVNCMTTKSLQVLYDRCSNKQNCSILASTTMFDDPCIGTQKYLEAHFQCISATSILTTHRPSPSWIVTSQSPHWSHIQPSIHLPFQVTKSGTTVAQEMTTTSTHYSQSTIGHFEVISSTIEPVINSIEDTQSANVDHTLIIKNNNSLRSYSTHEYTTDVTISNHQKNHDFVKSLDNATSDYDKRPIRKSDEHCVPIMFRSIHWNWTRVNETDIQPCPGGTTGFAKWKCLIVDTNFISKPVRYPTLPDLSQCRSVWLTSLEQRLTSDRDSITTVTNDLAQVTGSKHLYGGDMMITTKIIQKMTHKMAKNIQTFADTRQREAIVTEMLHDVVMTGSNLLDIVQFPSWHDLSYNEQMTVATSLLIGIEESAFLLADTVLRSKTINQVLKNIVLSVHIIETRLVNDENFPIASSWRGNNNTIELPRRALLENSDGGLIRLVFVAFNGLEELLQIDRSDSTDLLNEKKVHRVLNSKIISASLGKGRHIQLSEPVRLTLKHLYSQNLTNPICVFWDYTSNTWLEEGCYVQYYNLTHTVCLCDHLTNFGVLMEPTHNGMKMRELLIFRIFAYISCIAVSTCFVFLVIVFKFLRGLKGPRTVIDFNFAMCMSIAEIFLLLGIDQVGNNIVCSIIIFGLHYAFLCAILWMFFEGFQLHKLCMEVFEDSPSKLKWFYWLAYGLPLIVVCISFIIYSDAISKNQHCWLQAKSYVIYCFVGPVIIVYMCDMVCLAITCVMFYRRSTNSLTTSCDRYNTNYMRLLLFGNVIQMVVMGFTWLFGFLWFRSDSYLMGYAFLILNAIQGLYYLIFQCLQNEKSCIPVSCQIDSEVETSPHSRRTTVDSPPTNLSYEHDTELNYCRGEYVANIPRCINSKNSMDCSISHQCCSHKSNNNSNTMSSYIGNSISHKTKKKTSSSDEALNAENSIGFCKKYHWTNELSVDKHLDCYSDIYDSRLVDDEISNPNSPMYEEINRRVCMYDDLSKLSTSKGSNISSKVPLMDTNDFFTSNMEIAHGNSSSHFIEKSISKTFLDQTMDCDKSDSRTKNLDRTIGSRLATDNGSCISDSVHSLTVALSNGTVRCHLRQDVSCNTILSPVCE